MHLISKNGRKAIPRLGGTGKIPGGILHMSITTKTFPVPIDQGNLIEKVIGPLIRGMNLRKICCSTAKNWLQLTAVCCHRREM